MSEQRIKVLQWPPLAGPGPEPTEWFTSDLHFGHKSIATRRGFGTVEAMDYQLLENINRVVKPTDHLYITGDFSFRNRTPTLEYLQSFKCRHIVIVLGNHDNKSVFQQALDDGLIYALHMDRTQIRIKDDDGLNGKQRIVLDHFPLLVWDNIHRGAWMLHGHSHGGLKYPLRQRIMDIGIDTHPGLMPWSYGEIKDRLGTLKDEELDFPDHHVPKEPDECSTPE
jgi:calcineurin-like phosphoesterase family protein